MGKLVSILTTAVFVRKELSRCSNGEFGFFLKMFFWIIENTSLKLGARGVFFKKRGEGEN